MFSGSKSIHGVIEKPTGKENSQVNICGNYKVLWKNVHDKTKYCIVDISS